MSGYPYKALDSKKRQIRLIVLEDGDRTSRRTSVSDSLLRFSMIVTSLELYKDPPWHYHLPVNELNQMRNAFTRTFLSDQPFSKDFYALSYVWGDPAAVCDIKIDGMSVKIGANLYAALQSIRKNTKFRALWVDALCINQSDLEEKSWQVQQMAVVYSRARATISCLGPGSADSDLALRSLTELDTSTSDSYWSIQQAREGAPPPKKVKKGILRITNDLSRWNAIVSLCARPYWSRIWIFQEMAHGQQCYFLCGDYLTTRTWRPISLLIAWQVTQREILTDVFTPQCSAMVDSMLSLRFYGKHSTEPHYYIRSGTLNEILLKLGSLNATETRDKIYAPLCVATDRDKLRIVPDYTKSLRTIFIETACALARIESLGFLVVAAGQGPNTLNLPSWVPDWSTEVIDDFDRTHRADRGQLQRPQTLQAIESFSDQIILDAYALGKIIWIHDECPTEVSTRQSTDPLGSSTFSVWFDQLEATIEPILGQKNKNQNSQRVSYGNLEHTLVELLCGSINEQTSSSSTASTYLEVYRILKSARSLQSMKPDHNTHIKDEETITYLNRIHEILKTGTRPFLTDSGAIGLPQRNDTRVGDEVVIIPGVPVPCVLRPFGQGNRNYRLSCDAYVHGVMDGEFFASKRRKGDCALQVRTFTLY